MSDFDYAILGAGFAGLSLADALQKANQQVIVLEKKQTGSGASGTPGALVNPATGQKGKKSWRAEKCYKAIRKNLEKIQKHASTHFLQKNGVLRPAQTEKMAHKMKAQFDKIQWPDGWCYWLSEKKIKQKHPGIHCINGGLWLPIGMTVNGQQYLLSYTKWLESKGVKIKTNCETSISKKDAKWTVQSEKSTIKCNNIIYATGYGVTKNPFWEDLNLEPIKGQLAEFRTKEKLAFNHSVSGLGYVANGQNEHSFVQGSTYEHDFEDLTTDKAAVTYLKKRLKRMLPQTAKQVELISQWSGVRISAPNRKPVVGQHPMHKNLYLFTGLGSKGLLYGKYVAKLFSSSLLNGKQIPHEIDIERML